MHLQRTWFSTLKPRFAVGFAACLCCMAAGDVIYVDDDASGANDGASWDDAYVDLQAALGFAQDGDEIRVAAGTYYPETPSSTPDRSATFLIDVEDLRLIGGYPGVDDNEEPDPFTYASILDGDIDTSGPDHAYHVVTLDFDATDEKPAIIDGFTIQNGKADDTDTSGSDHRGGGLLIEGDAIVRRCIIRDNEAFERGGGAVVNTPSSSGCGGCQTFGTGCAEGVFVSCSFIDNTSASQAAAIGTDNAVSTEACLKAFSCLFTGNRAEGDDSNSNGGAIEATDDMLQLEIVNCTFADNYAYNAGGAIYTNDQTGLFSSNIMWKNTTDDIDPDEEEDQFAWGTLAEDINGDPAFSFTHNTVENLDSSIGWDASNNDSDPDFVDDDPSGGLDLHLESTSPMIDDGNTSDSADSDYEDDDDWDEDGDSTEPFADIDGDERIVNAGGCDIDRGAYEFQLPTCTWDLNMDGVVDPADLAVLLAAWDDPYGPSDLAGLLAEWGCGTNAAEVSCASGPGDSLGAYGLDSDDWDAFNDALGTTDEECYLCWMLHYLEDCEPFCTSGCTMCSDPYGGH